MAKKLGDKLNELLYKHGLSVAQLVEKGVGVKANTIHRWMKGERAPRLEQLEGVARYFGVSAIYLADDSIERPEDVGGAATLPNEERDLLEMGRKLGIKEATYLLERVNEIGSKVALERLNLRGLDMQLINKALARFVESS